MLIVRLLAGMALSLGAALGAQYLLSMASGEAGSTPADAGDITQSEPDPITDYDPAPVGEDRLAEPYPAGEAARWLADVLAGTGPYEVTGSDAPVDLAAIAADAAGSDAVGAAQCSPSHVMLSCVVSAGPDGPRYTFGLRNDNEAGWRVAEDSLSRL